MTGVQRGDVCSIADRDGERRLVVVTAVRDAYATVCLAHPDDECGTDHDAYFAPGTVARYPVWVQTDVRGVVFATQCDRRVGRLDTDQLAHVHAVASGTVSGDGLRLAGPLDPRWQFKLAEGATLRRLAAAATAAALESVEPT